MEIFSVEIILFVSDQRSSRDFYAKILGTEPMLDVPGMTEFRLGPGVKLGLMPETGAVRLFAGRVPDPAFANGVPRCELYLGTDEIENAADRARNAGAVEISPILGRDWGDRVTYFADPDGHVIAFAEKIEANGSSAAQL